MTSASLARGLRRSEPINKGTLGSSASCVNAGERGRTGDAVQAFLFLQFFPRWTKSLEHLGTEIEERKIRRRAGATSDLQRFHENPNQQVCKLE
ncbi:hypothetical protein PGIGA_G00114980 [Pangasianodon gigas]|uniref:Uncharacterized protein n=1 Tax=Pangasianodon gigas TaxID=30993 RepID=A0ACC5WAA3_PANGG|nr:hypothetical protein [Pangasianodon gigas]